MKKVIYLLLASLIFAGFSSVFAANLVLDQANLNTQTTVKFAADKSRTDLGFRMAGVEIESADLAEGAYQSVKPIAENPEEFGTTSDEGLPELPVFSQLVGIPDRSGVRLDVISAEFEIIEGYDILPFQIPTIEGSEDILPFVKNEEFYKRNEFYPSEPITLGEPVICRDLRMIQVAINPVQYNPVTRQLKVYTRIDYNLVYEGSDSRNIKTRRSNTIAESFLPLYRSIVPNADELLAEYQPIRGGYLIITPNAFADSAAVLGRWKHLKGYDVVIATGSDIDPNGSTPTRYEVQDFIRNAYSTWEIAPEYICIIGDVDLDIPDFPMTYGSITYTSDQEYSLADGDDFLSDIMVTRLSVPYNYSALSLAMNKSITYEKNPNMSDPAYWLRGLSVAGNHSAVTPRLTVLWVRHLLLSHGYTQVDTSFAWINIPGHPDYDPGPSAILSYMNNGVSLVSYRGWAGPSGWIDPNFSTGNLDQVTNNNKLGVMASIVCGTGAYGYGECFGEKWIRMGSSPTNCKGGPGFFGTTNTSTHTKWNNPIMIGYYWALFEEGIHNFALAAFRGKLNQYNCFPNHDNPGGRIDQYHHQYNTLGEPEFEVRTAIPQNMTATYPTTIPVGTNVIDIHVAGNGGAPLENAYVNLVKGYGVNEEVFVGGRTDSNGDITLDFSTTTADTIFVTVTATNFIPHIGFTRVLSQAVAVGVNSIAIDDDNSDNSSGNSDGNANPSETVEFAVSLKNFGNSTTATNVQATLTSSYPEAQVTVSNQSYGSIAPGATANSGKFAVHFDNDIPNGEHLILNLAIASDQGNWSAALPVDVKSMSFIPVATLFPGNSNGRLDPGETSLLAFQLQNIGELAGTSLSGVLSTQDPDVTITDNSGTFGDIGIQGTGSNEGSPFAVEVDYTVYRGHNVNFNLQLASSNGSVANVVIPVVVGSAMSSDPVGPDNYGYYMYDDTDVNYLEVPTYNWVEISPFAGGPGTRINFNTYDDDATAISLPFDMVYYGDTYDFMLVCINGFVAFDTSRYDMGGNRWSDSHNMHIPELGAPYGLIGPMWDDLEYSGDNGVFQYYDSANHRFIIEWKNMTHARTGSQRTFEMIVYDPAFNPTPTGDSELLFQYDTVANDDTDSGENPGLYLTVGIENYRNNDGLQYTFDNLYHPGAALLTSGRVIKITTATGVLPPPEIVYDPSSFTVNAEPGGSVVRDLDISNIGEGILSFNLMEVTDNRGPSPINPPVKPAPVAPLGYVEQPGNKIAGISEPYYPPVVAGFGGPDTFGHFWIDSDEPDGPAYNWVDISGSGVEVFPGEDGSSGPIGIGFDFPFFENSYSSLYINSNGNLTFGSGSGVYTNAEIPNPSLPNNQIAIYWDDLSPQNGHVYYLNDTGNNRFIVSYVNVPHWNTGGSLNFQAILFPTGQIICQYGSLEPGNDNLYNNTIGIENANGTDGLQVVFNSVYIHSDMAIKFSSPGGWLSSNIHSGTLAQNESVTAEITFDAAELTEGTYTGSIQIFCDDPTQSYISVPVTFTVGTAPVCDYVIGDYNYDQLLNISDIVAGFSKLKLGFPEPGYTCECPPGSGNSWAVAMDVNMSCTFNVADIVTAFSKLKLGIPELLPCPSCPPGGRAPRILDHGIIKTSLKSDKAVKFGK